MTGQRTVVVALLVASLLVLGYASSRVLDRGRFATPASTLSAGPKGTRALFELVQRVTKAAPKRWVQDFGSLHAPGTMIALADYDTTERRSLTSTDMRALERFVEAGGTLIVAGSRNYADGDNLGFSYAPSIDADEPKSLSEAISKSFDKHSGAEELGDTIFSEQDLLESQSAEAEGGEQSTDEIENRAYFSDVFRNLGVFRFSPTPGFTTTPSATAEVLLRDSTGTAFAVEIHRGQGTIIALASAKPFLNGNLVADQGAVIFDRILQHTHARAPFYFDEFHLGVGDRRSVVGYLTSVGRLGIFLQMLFVTAIFLWRRGVQFGAPITQTLRAPAGTSSYVFAMGSLFRQSGDQRGALALIAHRAIHVIGVHHHLDATDGDVLARELEARGRANAALQIRAILAILGRKTSPTHDILADERRIDELTHAALSE